MARKSPLFFINVDHPCFEPFKLNGVTLNSEPILKDAQRTRKVNKSQRDQWDRERARIGRGEINYETRHTLNYKTDKFILRDAGQTSGIRNG